jgi:cysteine desulfurase
MEAAQQHAWANPSSLHPEGLAAAEQLERSRLQVADALGCSSEEVVFTSGGSEAIHLALLGCGGHAKPARIVVSAVEHPATLAAARQLQARGWQLEVAPVDSEGQLDLQALEVLLEPPTRLMSLIGGQSEVGTIQPIEAIAALCRRAGVLLHVDAVQLVGHVPINFDALPVDLLSCAAHKLQGPRGIGALLVRRGLELGPLIGGGGQERGRRGGTEPVVLAAGMAAALDLAVTRLRQSGGRDPVEPVRDQLLHGLLQLPGVERTGPPAGAGRLPHHISLLIRTAHGEPMAGRALVRALAREGISVSSGSACSSQGSAASPVLLAMGYSEAEAAAGLRLSLGPWHQASHLAGIPDALARAIAAMACGQRQ